MAFTSIWYQENQQRRANKQHPCVSYEYCTSTVSQRVKKLPHDSPTRRVVQLHDEPSAIFKQYNWTMHIPTERLFAISGQEMTQQVVAAFQGPIRSCCVSCAEQIDTYFLGCGLTRFANQHACTATTRTLRIPCLVAAAMAEMKNNTQRKQARAR